MLRFVVCLMILPYVYGGTKCPSRAGIYPCICIDKPIGKTKFDTTVICRGLRDSNSLLAIEPALKEMEINKFLLYDSYWSNDIRRSDDPSTVPVNIISSFKMVDIDVVDTEMSSFGCPKEYNCRTNYLKRFTVINSTVPERTSCNNNGLTINAWISCPDNIEQVIIDQGISSDMTLKSEFFPEPMTKLKVLRMPNNHIARIDRRTFSMVKFPILETLDLSHNSLRDVKSIIPAMLKLKYLDLSFNSLRSVVDFQYLPQLHTLKLNGNQIISLIQSDWNHVPNNFRHLDLTNNNINCGCGIQFLNSTFHINAALLGFCGQDSSVHVLHKPLRKAARFLIERCDDQGKIGAKKKKEKGNSTAESF